MPRIALAVLVLLPFLAATAAAQEDDDEPLFPLSPPESIRAADHPWDDGTQIDVYIKLSLDDVPEGDPKPVTHYVIRRSGEYGGKYVDVGLAVPEKRDYHAGELKFVVEKLERGEPYFVRVAAVGSDGEESAYVETTEPVRATREWFSGANFWMGLITLLIGASVVGFILLARRGIPLRIRKIAGLEAVDEAVGRATEMGRPCLFVPGVQDINDIQTVAGLTILSRVARTAAEYDARIEVPTSRSLVMTTAREAVQSAYLAAGRPDAYHEDNIYYVTDEQFGYVAYLSGHMVREKPAACFYMGSFFAESLILAETGHSIGAIQVAGTAQPAQLPFFVAACDYTLIGEEFFAASAYLSGDPDQLGSLKGQDVGKVIVAVLLLAGCALVTLASPALIGGSLSEWFEFAGEYLRDTVLRAGT
ncbi:MAG TPA: fibronectin type III domain-containing protein [Planctomycetaceae bacterium]|nr:fibronectin type III domain-containing protein [Planctomycetaceae bacterium]